MTNRRRIQVRDRSTKKQHFSPFTNIGSLQLPWARIRGASLSERYQQTYEVLGGRFKTNNPANPQHIGVVDYALVAPAVARTLCRVSKAIDPRVASMPYVGLPLALLNFLTYGALRIADALTHALIVLPIAALLTVLCTPAILVAHFAFWLAKPDVVQLSEQLQRDNAEQAVHLGSDDDTAENQVTPKLPPSAHITTVSVNDERQVVVTFRDPAQARYSASLVTTEQKEAFKQLLAVNAFGMARFFDRMHDSAKKEEIGQLLNAPAPSAN